MRVATLHALLAVLLLLVVAPLAAQSVDGSAEWAYGRTTYRSGDNETNSGSFLQGYTLGYRSILWDPRFLTYTGELTFNKNALTFAGDQSASQQTGFKAAASVFPSRPFPFSIHASRGVGAETANYPESSVLRGGLLLPPGSAPELRTGRSDFGMSWQLAAKRLPRVEFGYQSASATVAAGGLEALQQQNSLQALVKRDGSRLSNTVRYQRSGFDNGVSQAFRQRYSDLSYELIANANHRTSGTVRVGRRTTYSLFDVPPQFTDIGVDGYHPPAAGEVDLDYGLATLTHQPTSGLFADLSVGYDRERSAAAGTSALLGTASTRYVPFRGLTLRGSGTYGERGQELDATRLTVLTRALSAGAEYFLMLRFLRAGAGYEAGHAWNTGDRGVEGQSRMWRGRADASTDVFRVLQIAAGYEQERSEDQLLAFGNLWRERSHGSIRSTLTPRIWVEANAELASIDRGRAPALFHTRYMQTMGSASVELTRNRHMTLTAGRFLNRSFDAEDRNEYAGVSFFGTVVGLLHLSLTARREHTISNLARVDQAGYYTSGLLEYRLRLFTFSLEHRYTDLALSTASQTDPLTFTGNQILFRVGRRFGFGR